MAAVFGLFAVLLCSYFHPGIGQCPIGDYFPDFALDASHVRWAHAVNSWNELETALNDPNIHMLEADISCGWSRRPIGTPEWKRCSMLETRSTTTVLHPKPPRGSACRSLRYPGNEVIPVMAHPPAQQSDVTLEDWLDRVICFLHENPHIRKGVKLDFKSLGAAMDSMPILEERQSVLEFPVWINADIVTGPVRAKPSVPGQPFLRAVMSTLPNATLSVGWTTSRPDGSDPKFWRYSWIHVTTMFKEITGAGINSGHSLSFPVRASFVTRSMEPLRWLLEATGDNSTLTVWTSNDDPPVDASDMASIQQKFGPSRVFFDIPSLSHTQLRGIPLRLESSAGRKQEDCGRDDSIEWKPINSGCFISGSNSIVFLGECMATHQLLRRPRKGQKHNSAVVVSGILQLYESPEEDASEPTPVNSVMISMSSTKIVWMRAFSNGSLHLWREPKPPAMEYIVSRRPCLYFELTDAVYTVTMYLEPQDCWDSQVRPLNDSNSVRRDVEPIKMDVDLKSAYSHYDLTVSTTGEQVKVIREFSYTCYKVALNSSSRYGSCTVAVIGALLFCFSYLLSLDGVYAVR